MKYVEMVKLQGNKPVMMVTHLVSMGALLIVKRKKAISAMEDYLSVVLFVEMESLPATNNVMMEIEMMEMDAHIIVRYREEADAEDSLQGAGNDKKHHIY